MAMTNPLLDEINGLSPDAKSALLQAHSASQNAPAQLPVQGAGPGAPMTPPPAAPRASLVPPKQPEPTAPSTGLLTHPMAPAPSLAGQEVMTPPAPPSVMGMPWARGTLQGDKNEENRLIKTGSGISQIAGKVEGAMPNHPLLGKILGGGAQALATLGDVGLSSVAPIAATLLPGTTYHHALLVKQAAGTVDQDEANAEKQAQTKNLELTPQLRQAQAALAQEKQNEVESNHQATQQNNQDKYRANLAAHGYAPDETDATGQKLRPLRYDEMSESQQAVHDLKSSQDELAQATTELRKLQADPNSPQYRLAAQRIEVARQNAQTAAGRLGLSTQEFGFNQEKFFNPQPTAAERGKGDLAQSALDRVAEMRKIVKNHPEYFGPVAGRQQNAEAWLGSSDPDAVTYNTAAQYLADHSAGVFGGRGQYITQALHGITDPKYTPEGLNAALDEAERAAQGFAKAGTVHGKGTQGAAAAVAGDGRGNPAGPPKAGDVVDGYRFKGGNPADQKNWEKQ
jgi:hypothetical protein